MICNSEDKSVVRFLWEKAINESVEFDAKLYRQPYVVKGLGDSIAEVNPACLWLASDDFRDVLPIVDKFKVVHIPESCSKSKQQKRKNLSVLPEHVVVLNGDIKSHLDWPGLDYMVINLDLVGHYNDRVEDLVLKSIERLYIGGLLFLTVSNNSRNTRGLKDSTQRRKASGPWGIIHSLYERIPDMDEKLLYIEGFPRSYVGNNGQVMHTLGWKVIS